MTNIRGQLGWRNMFAVSCSFVKKKGGKGVSRAGRIALLWEVNTSASLLSYSDNHIDVTIDASSTSKSWRFTGFYGQPRVQDRHLSWSLLKLLAHKSPLPWLTGGDFNEILTSQEKQGGPTRNSRQMSEFMEAVDVCSLQNIHSVGPRFTWHGIRGGQEIMVRLDRFMASEGWWKLFPASRALNLKPSKSDHLPILLEVREFAHRKKKKKKKKRKRFRFEDSWLLNDDCKKFIDLGWNMAVSGSDPVSKIRSKISNTRETLMKWSKSLFGKIKEDIEQTRASLAQFYNYSPSNPSLVSRVELEDKLNDFLQQEHAFWKQRAKVFWLTDGDLNTKIFHQSACNRRKRNLIVGLHNADGDWCTSDEDLEMTVIEYFENLFTSSQPLNITETVCLLPRIITDDINFILTKKVTKDEIHFALKQMHPSKSPGPDGFSPGFYQQFWPLVGNDVGEAIQCFLDSDSKLQQVNHTHVALIPKVKTPQHMTQLRPISLCNVLYKIGSKAMANRLKPLLHHFISPSQSAFISGRHISDNSLVAFEIAHFLKRKREGNTGYGTLKLDMSKAYDRVE